MRTELRFMPVFVLVFRWVTFSLDFALHVSTDRDFESQEFEDLTNDVNVGFQVLTTDDIDEMKPSGIIKAIKERVGDTPTYLSFDIDTIDPSMAPASTVPSSHHSLYRMTRADQIRIFSCFFHISLSRSRNSRKWRMDNS